MFADDTLQDLVNTFNFFALRIAVNSRPHHYLLEISFPGGSVVKNWPAMQEISGDVGLIPRWERSPGEGNGNPLQYSCLGNGMDRGAWRATVHGFAESDTT